MEESRDPPGGPPIVEGKLSIPSLPERVVPRPRLEEELSGLIDRCRVVRVSASPGAGKTTAVVQGVARLDRRVAWLTLDETEASPGSLLTYVEATLRRTAERPADLPPVAAEAMAAGVLHRHAAALLAEAIPAAPTVLVLDELERIAESGAALEVLSTLVRYAPLGLKTVLIGRSDVHLDALARFDVAELGELGDGPLAFTAEEAAAALALRGQTSVDASSVVEAVGGWVTGVLFEAWRSRRHVGGSGGEEDPLAGYLAEEIIAALDAEERDFLVVTSLLPEVDAGLARALGQDRAGELLARLRARHLPLTWRREAAVMRCHPRFREYLRSLLERRDPGEVRELRRRHGLALAELGRDADAVEELLAAGCVVDAAGPAERALGAVIARLDLDLAQRWLDRFDAAGLLDRPGLLAAQLGVAIAVEEFRRAVDAADRLERLPVTGDDGDELAEHRALAAWAYWHVGRLDDARRMLGAASGHVADVVRYLFSLVDDRPPRTVPEPDGGPLDALLLRIAYVRGRLAQVRDAPVSDWTPAATEKIAAHRALGDLERTREMLTAGPSTLSNLRFEGTVRCELMMDLGHEEQAREALLRGRARIARSGSVVFDLVSRLLAARLELRMRGDAAGVLVALHGIELSTPVRSYGYLAEQLDLWAGYALLLEGRDDEALDRLRAAVASMRGADRILELPTAGAYLAEAEWRAGNAELADAAADLALEVARRQGSRHLLLQALEDVPGALARRLDAERSADGEWHELGRALAAQPGAAGRPLGARARLRDLGRPTLLVDAEPRRARIAKTYALLAYLVRADGEATRGELLGALFDGRDDASTRAYLRQAVHGLRGLLPDGVDLRSEGGVVRLGDPRAVESDSGLLEARLATAARRAGAARVTAYREALALGEAGPYLDGIESAWVRERRDELEEQVAAARVELAVAAFEESEFETATEVLEEVVERDPFRERAWRLLMRVAAAQGADDQVIDAYRRCGSALAELGLEPGETTRSLAEGLRR